MSANSLRQTVHTHRASVHQAAKLVAALLRVAWVTVGLAESNGSLPPGLWLTSPADWLLRTGISSGTLRSAVEYGLPFPYFYTQRIRSRFTGDGPERRRRNGAPHNPNKSQETITINMWLQFLCSCWIYMYGRWGWTDRHSDRNEVINEHIDQYAIGNKSVPKIVINEFSIIIIVIHLFC